MPPVCLPVEARWGSGGGSSPPVRRPPRKSLMLGEAVQGVGCLRGDSKTVISRTITAVVCFEKAGRWIRACISSR